MITDFLSFTVPGGDEGCGGFDDARAMLRLAAESGVERLVTAARFDPAGEEYRDYARRVAPGMDFIARRDFKTAPELLLPAAAVTVREGLEAMEELEELCVLGTRTVLLDMPAGRWSEELAAVPLKIKNRGLTPVILNAELHGAAGRYAPQGVACCFGATAFTSLFGRKKMLEAAASGQAAAIASGLVGVRGDYVDFQRAMKALGGSMDIINASMDALLKQVG